MEEKANANSEIAARETVLCLLQQMFLVAFMKNHHRSGAVWYRTPRVSPIVRFMNI